MIRGILNALRCAAFGHEPLILESCERTDALMHIGMNSISLAKVRLCRRCMVIHWVPGDSVRDKTVAGVEAMDAAVSAKFPEAMNELMRKMSDKAKKNGPCDCEESKDDEPGTRHDA